MMTNDYFETWRELHRSRPDRRLLRRPWDGPDQFLPEERSKPDYDYRAGYDSPEGQLHYQSESRVRACRHDLTRVFSWAVPSPCAVQRLVELSPIVEVGAGTGWWARCVRDAGGEIIATDAGGETRRFYHGDAPSWTAVLVMDAAEAAARWADRTLFLCWPPYDDGMAAAALTAYLRAGGRTVAYVGEGDGGCTGDGLFYRLLDRVFTDGPEVLPLPQWDGIHDEMCVYRR